MAWRLPKKILSVICQSEMTEECLTRKRRRSIVRGSVRVRSCFTDEDTQVDGIRFEVVFIHI